MARATACSVSELLEIVGTPNCPPLLDVRRAETFAAARDLLPTARWRDPAQVADWAPRAPDATPVVVYCGAGHEVGQGVAAGLCDRGIEARYLAGGIAAWREAGGPLLRRSALTDGMDRAASVWVTRERPKIDRVACPWLIRRFVDRDARIVFVAPQRVETAAREIGGTPFDIPGVAFSHDGEKCSFDAFLAAFGLGGPALERIAVIVRGADTGRLDLAPEAAGLLAMSLGLSASHADDLAMTEQGFQLYDALYAWARKAAAERHGWPPATGR